MPLTLPCHGQAALAGCLVLLLLLPALTLAQELYTCTTPAGRFVMRDTPCPVGSTESIMKRPEHPPPPPTGAPRTLRGSARPPASASKNAIPTEPDVPEQECVHVNDVATNVLDLGHSRYNLQWKVDLSNRCKRPMLIALTFGLYDKNDFEIRAARRSLRLPARDSLTEWGTLSLSQSELQRISAKKAAVQLR